MDSGVANQDGGVNTGGFDPSAVVQALATASCGFEARCQPAVTAFGLDTASCESNYVLTNRDSFVQHGSAIVAGRVSFSQAQFDACIAEFSNVDCDLGLTLGGPCSRYLTGTQAQGAGCQLGAECADGLACVPVGGGSACGVCQQRAAVGGDCSVVACERGLRCFGLNDGRSLCLAANGVGQPCGDVQNGLCAGELWCDNITNPAQAVCARPPGQDQACDPQFTTAGNCNLLANLNCVNGTCQPITWVAAGAVCDGATNLCRIDTFCAVATPGDPTGLCTALPTTSETCTTELGCAGDDFCDPATTICTPRTQNGGTCAEVQNGMATQTSLCEVGSFCSAATLSCEGSSPWMQCN